VTYRGFRFFLDILVERSTFGSYSRGVIPSKPPIHHGGPVPQQNVRDQLSLKEVNLSAEVILVTLVQDRRVGRAQAGCVQHSPAQE
jgi:hypothetical protein